MPHVLIHWPKATSLPPQKLPAPLLSKPRRKKSKKYQVAPSKYEFIPFAVETLGPFGEKALALVKDLGRRIYKNTGEIRSMSWLT
jgi:hypothetical protein